MADVEVVGRRASVERLGVWGGAVSISALGFPATGPGPGATHAPFALWLAALRHERRVTPHPYHRLACAVQWILILVPFVLQVAAYRRELDVRVGGFDVPRPVRTFAQCGFDADLMAAIKKAG